MGGGGTGGLPAVTDPKSCPGGTGRMLHPLLPPTRTLEPQYLCKKGMGLVSSEVGGRKGGGGGGGRS